MSTARASPEDLRELLHRVSAPRGRPVRGRVLLPRRMTLSRKIDGVWWPRCRELRIELPTVLPSVGLRLRTLERIELSDADWDLRGFEGSASDLSPVGVSALGPPGRISFGCGDTWIVFGLIPPSATSATAADLSDFFLRE